MRIVKRRLGMRPRSHRVLHKHRGLKFFRTHMNRRERHEVRIDLHMGREPFPYQPRSRARWEMD